MEGDICLRSIVGHKASECKTSGIGQVEQTSGEATPKECDSLEIGGGS